MPSIPFPAMLLPLPGAQVQVLAAHRYPVMFYDGVCNMCNGSVQFVMRFDRSHSIRFLSLQSNLAADLLLPFGQDNKELFSMLLLHEGKLYSQTDAIFRTAMLMGGIWAVFGQVGLWVPRPLRNAIYRVIARNRYNWFGKKETCPLPSPELRARSLG